MIHFSHGNGFPTETYHQVIKGLRKRAELEVGYISCLGHNPTYPVIDSWSHLVDEVIEYVENTYKEPVIGIGHSLGGVISYAAGLKRPDLFKAVLLLDSPLYSTWKLKSIAIIKALGLVDYVTPARVTRYRRITWPSHEAAMQHFANKRVFRYFTEKCLRDYVYLGTIPTGNKSEVTLRFNRMIEWQIYKTLPHVKMDRLSKVPCGLIYGQYSKVIRPQDAKSMVDDYDIWCHRLDNCGHLFPFEKPEETVDAILDFISTL